MRSGLQVTKVSGLPGFPLLLLHSKAKRRILTLLPSISSNTKLGVAVCCVLLYAPVAEPREICRPFSVLNICTQGAIPQIATSGKSVSSGSACSKLQRFLEPESQHQMSNCSPEDAGYRACTYFAIAQPMSTVFLCIRTRRYRCRAFCSSRAAPAMACLHRLFITCCTGHGVPAPFVHRVLHRPWRACTVCSSRAAPAMACLPFPGRFRGRRFKAGLINGLHLEPT